MKPHRFKVVALFGVLAAGTIAILILLVPRPESRERLAVAPLASVSREESAMLHELVAADTTPATSSMVSTQGVSDRRSVFQGRIVSIGSATGLHVEWVEVDDGRGEWNHADVVDGTLLLESVDRPVSIRAAGHRAATLAPNTTELVLEPDAMFVIEGDQLRERMLEIDLGAKTAAQRARSRQDLSGKVMHGFVSERRWVAAVSAKPLASPDLHSPVTAGAPRTIIIPPKSEQGWLAALHITAEFVDGRRVQITYRPRSGARDVWEAATMAVEMLPLLVEIHGDHPPTGNLATDLFDLRRDDARDRAEFEWGWVRITHAPDAEHTGISSLGAQTIDFGPRAASRRYGLVVRALDCSVYGRSFFVHDGSTQRIELQEGLSVTGRLRFSAEGAKPNKAQIKWCRRFESDRRAELRSAIREVALRDDGTFLLTGPERVHEIASSPDSLPPLLELEIETKGFQPWKHVFDAASVRHFDAGDIDILSWETDFFVPFTDEPRELRVSGIDAPITLGTSTELSWTARMRIGREDRARGGVLFTLQRDTAGEIAASPSSENAAPLLSPAWTDARVTSVSQWRTRNELAAYARDGGDRFVRVPSMHMTLDVEFATPPPDGTWITIEHAWRTTSNRALRKLVDTRPIRVEFEGPLEDSTWTWKLHGRPDLEDEFRTAPAPPLPQTSSASGVIPVTSAQMKLQIP